jgi:hypothetical protein
VVAVEDVETVETACRGCMKFLREFLKEKAMGYLYARKEVADNEDKEYF